MINENHEQDEVQIPRYNALFCLLLCLGVSVALWYITVSFLLAIFGGE